MWKSAALLLLLASPRLEANAYDDALATALEADAKVKASSSVHSPSANNFQQVKGELEVLPPFFDRLVRDLSKVKVGPASEVSSVALDVKLKIGTVSGLNSVFQLDLFIETCRGISGQLKRLEGLLPGLIAELRKGEPAAVKTVSAATQWTPPTPTPGVVVPGQPQPLPTLAPPSAPTPQPAPTAMIPQAPPQGPPSSGPDFGVIPGGSGPPPPPPVNVPPSSGPFPTPTPLPPLKVPVSLAIASHGGKVYIANVNAGTVSVLDADLRRVVKEIPVGSQPAALALSNGNSLLVVANYGSSTASLIDTRSETVVATLKTSDQPVDVALSNDGHEAYVVCQAGARVTVLDLKKQSAGRNIKVGLRPARIVIPHNSKYAYVSNSGEDTISVIDLRLQETIATIEE